MDPVDPKRNNFHRKSYRPHQKEHSIESDVLAPYSIDD